MSVTSLSALFLCVVGLAALFSDLSGVQAGPARNNGENTKNSPASGSLGRPNSLTPSSQTDDEPAECYVEVRQTRMVPGRCLPVGRRQMPHLCQTKDSKYISLQNDCAAVLEKKTRKAL